MNANTQSGLTPDEFAQHPPTSVSPGVPAFANEGETFQHYQVLRRPDGSLWELGRGAMGVTYKAFDTNLRCHVALKVISAQYLHSEVAGQRFIREARVAARLRHPNIATVYHLGIDPQGFFYSMEFIDGQTLEDLLARTGPLPLDGVLQVGMQTARALAAASRQGLIHRDIKPSNLMLLDQGDDHEDELAIKVIDFGLARSYDPSDSHARLTMSGFVGTPLYASPEQLEEKDLDVRSDIYSLGVTLWILLTGQPPFEGKMTQVITQHLNAEPPWWQLSECPEEARAILERMLKKDPAERYQSAAELRQALEDCRRFLRYAGKVRPGDLHAVQAHRPTAQTAPANVPHASLRDTVSAAEASMLGRLGTMPGPIFPGPSRAVGTATPLSQVARSTDADSAARSRLWLRFPRAKRPLATMAVLVTTVVLGWFLVGSMSHTPFHPHPETASAPLIAPLVPKATAEPVLSAIPADNSPKSPVAPDTTTTTKSADPVSESKTAAASPDLNGSAGVPASPSPIAAVDGSTAAESSSTPVPTVPPLAASPSPDGVPEDARSDASTPTAAKSPTKATAGHTHTQRSSHRSPTPAPNFFQKLFGIKPKPHPR